MSYGDYSGEDKPNKGQENGACNRRLCQAEPAIFYNHGSYSWYCVDCATDIGQDVVNKREWELRWQPRLGHPQFETREQINARKIDESAQKVKVDDFHKDQTDFLSMFPEYKRPKSQDANFRQKSYMNLKHRRR